MEYEGQICRAPMERSSYMLPIMVGCNYNGCRFCNLFRHVKYRVLPIDQVEQDLARVRDAGGVPRQMFLGDGNAFTLPIDHLLRVLGLIHEYLPGEFDINMDATMDSIAEKSDEDLRKLADAGVKHVYLGIETGLEDVLAFMEKGHTKEQVKEQIARIQSVGMCFDAHIMTGVAGSGRGEENARALASFLNETHPSHVVNFSMFIQDQAPIWENVQDGTFVPATELENLKEERVLVSELYKDAPAGLSLKYEGFHDCVEVRVRGVLPRDREAMIAKLDEAIDRLQGEADMVSYVYGGSPHFFNLNNDSTVAR